MDARAAGRGRHRGTGAAPRGTGWRRARALLAAGVVVGVGSAATLASWTDTEWVWGGNAAGDVPGLGASVFEVQQNVWDGAAGAARWDDGETAPEAGMLGFSLGATALSPGDTVYAPVQLRTVVGSDAGVLTLSPATARDGDAGFFAALRYQVRTGVPAGACTAAAFGSTGADLVPAGQPLSTGSGATTFALGAGTASDPGTAEDLCFAVTLPAGAPDSLQGLGATPLWAFQAISG